MLSVDSSIITHHMFMSVPPSMRANTIKFQEVITGMIDNVNYDLILVNYDLSLGLSECTGALYPYIYVYIWI